MLLATPAGAEWAVGGYLGAAHTMTNRLSVAQPAVGTDVTFASINYFGDSYTPPVYYGYRFGYFFGGWPWLGIEAEFIHVKAYARTDAVTRVTGQHLGVPVDRDAPVQDVLERFSISHGLNFALANLVMRRKLASSWADGRVSLVGRMGLGPTIPHPESQISGVSHEGYELGALGLHLSGGVDVRIWRGLGVFGEYKLTTTDQTVSVDQGQAHGRFTSHHGVFGLGWHF